MAMLGGPGSFWVGSLGTLLTKPVAHTSDSHQEAPILWDGGQGCKKSCSPRQMQGRTEACFDQSPTERRTQYYPEPSTPLQSTQVHIGLKRYSKGSGTPAEILSSAPYGDYRQQKLEFMFKSLLLILTKSRDPNVHRSTPDTLKLFYRHGGLSGGSMTGAS